MTQKRLKDMDAYEEAAAYPISTIVMRVIFCVVAAIPLVIASTVYALWWLASYALLLVRSAAAYLV
jgi:hypothetical protein